MLADHLLPQVHAYLDRPALRQALGVAPGEAFALAFLAQGEYNINYRLDLPAQRLARVVRVNVGSQIGKSAGEQIAYEAAALRLLGPHGVAPQLHYLDDTLAALPYGLLVMEFLPGTPLDYANPAHIRAAAGTLARLHTVPAEGGSFIRRRALHDDLAEAQAWLGPYLACDRAPADVRRLFQGLLDRAARSAERDAARFPAPFALAHTDVQAHNFIVSQQPADNCTLVDWERPLLDDPTYDLAHFLIPTTTQWKCGHTFSEAEHELFLAAYCAARPGLHSAELRERLRVRRPFILLRAISWCAGAWVEYTGPGRAIDNRDTLAKIEDYLRPAYLRTLFGEWIGA